uniref:Uncharacterized protein n=1 Tax=Oryza rufipogon TaxID=4529 RepID=A0A0E0P5S0_ORYRU
MAGGAGMCGGGRGWWLGGVGAGGRRGCAGGGGRGWWQRLTMVQAAVVAGAGGGVHAFGPPDSAAARHGSYRSGGGWLQDHCIWLQRVAAGSPDKRMTPRHPSPGRTIPPPTHTLLRATVHRPSMVAC